MIEQKDIDLAFDLGNTAEHLRSVICQLYWVQHGIDSNMRSVESRKLLAQDLARTTRTKLDEIYKLLEMDK